MSFISLSMKIVHTLWWFVIIFGLCFLNDRFLLFFCVFVCVFAIILFNIGQLCFMNYLENCFHPTSHGNSDNKISETMSAFFNISQQTMRYVIKLFIYTGMFVGFYRFYKIQFSHAS